MAKRAAKKDTPPKEEKPSDLTRRALSMTFSGKDMKVYDDVLDILNDATILEQMAELARSGASIDTIEMAAGINSGLLERWLRNGKQDKEGPYRLLFLFLSRASAESRIAAEAQLLAKNPLAWLDRIDMRTQLNKMDESSPEVAGKIATKSSVKKKEGTDFLEMEDDLIPTKDIVIEAEDEET